MSLMFIVVWTILSALSFTSTLWLANCANVVAGRLIVDFDYAYIYIHIRIFMSFSRRWCRSLSSRGIVLYCFLTIWQAEQYQTKPTKRSISEFNWWRVTKSEIATLSVEIGLSCKELRALPRKTFRTIVRRVSWKRELASRLEVMKSSARLSHIARELQTRQLRNPNLLYVDESRWFINGGK